MLLKRREFIRIIGGTALATTIAPGQVFAQSAASFSTTGVLVEANAFTYKGGWALDTQHYQQMGGCYLLAHGMGEPVENPIASANIPETGEWHVFVRTRNWCPGDWEAPGQFKVHVNGKALDKVFGIEDEKWGWQSGGTINFKKAGTALIELEDLTGFEGRCDAIFFSKDANPDLPNDNLVELTAWKDQVTGRDKVKIKEHDFDLVIVGGGMSGCASAIAARKQGLKVAIVQDRPVFGGNASDEIRVHSEGIHGKGEDILRMVDTEHYPNGSEQASVDQRKRESAMIASGTHLFASHMCVGLEKEGSTIKSIEARDVDTGLIKRLRAPVFVDATGDGWLGFWAGAEYRYGREAASEFNEEWEQYGELWAPEEADNRVMGTSVLWSTEHSYKAIPFPEVPWAEPVAKDNSATMGTWHWEYSDNDLDQIDDAEQIRDHMFRAIYGSFANAKLEPSNATLRLDWVSFIGGKRESRRIMGDHIYSMNDALSKTYFDDTVVEETRALDSHYQEKHTGLDVDFLSEALFRRPKGTYYIPFRSLYAKDIDNLMLAGRNFSCTHIGLAGPRVMNTCGQMGIATGYAAALCKTHNATPREVGKKHIKELRSLIGYTEEDK